MINIIFNLKFISNMFIVLKFKFSFENQVLSIFKKCIYIILKYNFQFISKLILIDIKLKSLFFNFIKYFNNYKEEYVRLFTGFIFEKE